MSDDGNYVLEPVTDEPALKKFTERKCCCCETDITGEYYLANGTVWCPECCNNGRSEKAKLGCWTPVKIIAVGYTGALLGGGLWATVIYTTNYEIGLIAVLVGLIVGFAVKWSAGSYQGRFCQVVALILTFLGLSYSVIPVLVKDIREDPKLMEMFKNDFSKTNGKPGAEGQRKLVEADGRQTKKTPEVAEAAKTRKKAEPDPDPGMTDSGKKAIQPGQVQGAEPNALAMILAAVLLLIICVFMLFFGSVIIYLIYLVTSPLSIVFMGIALWEAWKLNKPQEVSFQGPFHTLQELDLEKAEFTS